jgi:hypothetical protein
MDRREVSRVLIGVAAGSALLPRSAVAATCNQPPATYPAIYAETQQNIPINTAYPPGNLLRYGPQCYPSTLNNGSTASDTALANAILVANYAAPTGYGPAPATIYAPAGVYIFTTGVSTATRGSFTLTGDSHGTSGTVFQLTSSATDAAILTFTAAVQFLRIEKILFQLTGTAAQYCLLFSYGVRDTLIDDCFFYGNQDSTTSNTGCIGIAVLTASSGSNYTGDFEIRHCQIEDCTCGISLSGEGLNTSVRITSCEFSTPYLSNTVGFTYGIDMSNLCQGVLIQGCTLEGWSVGILCQGVALKQIANWFGGNVNYDWYWSQGSGNTTVSNASVADTSVKSAAPSYYFPSGTNCYVVGAYYT